MLSDELLLVVCLRVVVCCVLRGARCCLLGVDRFLMPAAICALLVVC